jgi:hypothetical protein
MMNIHTNKQGTVINVSRMIIHTTKRVPFIIHANVAFEALEPFAVNQIP